MLNNELHKILSVTLVIIASTWHSEWQPTQEPERMLWQRNGLQLVTILDSTLLSEDLLRLFASQACLELLHENRVCVIVLLRMARIASVSPAACFHYIPKQWISHLQWGIEEVQLTDWPWLPNWLVRSREAP